jgi:threonine dehydrogenase-like Zn-dependent dehydrogenase
MPLAIEERKIRQTPRGVIKRFGATVGLLAGGDEVQKIRNLTDGRGVDVAIEALGIRQPLRTPCAFCDPAAPSPALPSIPAICESLWRASLPAWATTPAGTESRFSPSAKGSNSRRR